MAAQNTKPEKMVMSIRESARSSGIPESYLRSLLKAGKLPGFYTGRKFLVHYPALCEQLERQSQKEVVSL